MSTDRIAYPAMRCAVILGDLSRHVPTGELARDGSGLIVEAYPDAALRCWLPNAWTSGATDSYKGSGAAARTRREGMLEELLAALGPRFGMPAADREACVEADDCLDALACALLARAAQQGFTRGPEDTRQQDLALTEGWIHLPEAGSLQKLCT